MSDLSERSTNRKHAGVRRRCTCVVERADRDIILIELSGCAAQRPPRAWTRASEQVEAINHRSVGPETDSLHLPSRPQSEYIQAHARAHVTARSRRGRCSSTHSDEDLRPSAGSE